MKHVPSNRKCGLNVLSRVVDEQQIFGGETGASDDALEEFAIWLLYAQLCRIVQTIHIPCQPERLHQVRSPPMLLVGRQMHSDAGGAGRYKRLQKLVTEARVLTWGFPRRHFIADSISGY